MNTKADREGKEVASYFQVRYSQGKTGDICEENRGNRKRNYTDITHSLTRASVLPVVFMQAQVSYWKKTRAGVEIRRGNDK